MRRILRFCLLSVASLAWSGCANLNINEPLESSVTAAAGQAYLYGRFDEVKGSLNISSLWLRLENTQTKATFEIQVETGVQVFAVEPGTYRFTEFMVMAGGAPKSMLTKLDVKSAPIYPTPQPFSVEAGRAYYLGDFNANSDSQYGVFESKLVNTMTARNESYEATTDEVKLEYPGLNQLEFDHAVYEEESELSSVERS